MEVMKVGLGGGCVGSGIVGEGLGTTAVKVGSGGRVAVCGAPQLARRKPRMRIGIENFLSLICTPGLLTNKDSPER
jgi:hypothetical protein